MYEPIQERQEGANQWGCSANHDGLAGAATILLLEDEAFVREVTGEVLRTAGYRVLTATNAGEAECIYEAHRGDVNLLLADVVLAGETGRALAGRLQRENPALKVLLVTGYAEQMSSPESKREECLAKPFSTDALLRRVRQLLDRRAGPVVGTTDLLKHACGNG